MKPKPNAAWLPILSTVLLATMACSLVAVQTATPAPTPPPQATAPAGPVPTDTRAPIADTPVPDPAAACPTPSEGSSLYVSRENGFCFLYPLGFTLQPDFTRPEEALSLIGPREPGDSIEPISVLLGLAYNGPADGLDAAAYAERWLSLYAEGEPRPGPASPAMIAGQPAVVISNLPGFATQRAAFLIANGIKYSLTLMPEPETFPALAEPANRAWNMLVDSLVFFPPENTRSVVRAADVCPAPAGDARLYRNDKDGYCFLYPAGFELNPTFPGQVVGGPVVLTDPSFGEVRTSLTLGTFGTFPGLTPRQVLEPRAGLIDSVEDTTLGGFPAAVFRNSQGPWASKQAMILVDGSAYTIVAQPFEPEAYPAGMPYLDQLWNTVTASLAFFDPFR